MSDLQAIAEATAAVYVARRDAGSAVLVDDRHLLTAAHVLRHRTQAGGPAVLAAEVEVAFPALRATRADQKVPARRIVPEPGSTSADVAVLDLGQHPPGWLPKPLPLWPARRLPQRVKVFGYPRAERDRKGVWRDFDTSGPTAADTVQLDWTQGTGTFVGHSGGPVLGLDTVHATLVGVLVEGSPEGRFDRFVPVTRIAECWPDLPRPWLFSGLQAAGARDHFDRRAHGQRSRARGGDLFRGRDAALAAVYGWLTAADAPGRPLVVTGQPGAGKSAVIARAALRLEAGRVAPGLAFHARGVAYAELVTAIADLTDINLNASDSGLISALQEKYDPGGNDPGGPWRIVVDALDEAATATDRRRIAELLTDLAMLSQLRVAVATRPLTIGDRYGPGGLLIALGVTSASSPGLVDLDTDRYFDPAGVRGYAAALLAQLGAARPGPPGGAWACYRADTRLRDRLADVIAERAGRNYLVAAMAADRLSADPTVVDPDAPAFEPHIIPSGVGEALSKYLDALAPRRRVHVRAARTYVGQISILLPGAHVVEYRCAASSWSPERDRDG